MVSSPYHIPFLLRDYFVLDTGCDRRMSIQSHQSQRLKFLGVMTQNKPMFRPAGYWAEVGYIYIHMIVWGNGIFISKILGSKSIATLCHVDGILVVAVSAGDARHWFCAVQQKIQRMAGGPSSVLALQVLATRLLACRRGGLGVKSQGERWITRFIMVNSDQ